jgi:hypothetical protein
MMTEGYAHTIEGRHLAGAEGRPMAGIEARTMTGLYEVVVVFGLDPAVALLRVRDALEQPDRVSP